MVCATELRGTVLSKPPNRNISLKMLWNHLAIPTGVQAVCGLLLIAYGTVPGYDIIEQDKEPIAATTIAKEEMISYENIFLILAGIFLLLVAPTGCFVLVRKHVILYIICVLSNVSIIILQLTVLLILQGTHLQCQFYTAVFSVAIFSSAVCLLMVVSKCYSNDDKCYSEDDIEISYIGNGLHSELYFNSES